MHDKEKILENNLERFSHHEIFDEWFDKYSNKI